MRNKRGRKFHVSRALKSRARNPVRPFAAWPRKVVLGHTDGNACLFRASACFGLMDYDSGSIISEWFLLKPAI